MRGCLYIGMLNLYYIDLVLDSTEILYLPYIYIYIYIYISVDLEISIHVDLYYSYICLYYIARSI